MNAAILVLITAPFGLAILWMLLEALAAAGADPGAASGGGESRRQRQLLGRALEAHGWWFDGDSPAPSASRIEAAIEVPLTGAPEVTLTGIRQERVRPAASARGAGPA